MLGRLRSLLLAFTGNRTRPAARPFRPALEYLGDRTLPSAGHAAAGGAGKDANPPGHEHAEVVAQGHDPTDEKSNPHANANSDSRADRDHRDRDVFDAVSNRSDPGERGTGSDAKADKADSHGPARSKGGDEDHRDAKADSTDSRVSVRSKAKGGAADDRRDSKADSADSSASGHFVEVSPSAGEFEVAIHSVPVPVDVELAERSIRVEPLPAGSVADRPNASPDHVVDNREEPTPITRAEQREVLVELPTIPVAERYLSPPDTEAGVASGVMVARRDPPATPARPAGDGTAYGPPRPSEAPGDARAAPPGTTDAAGWPRLRGTASERNSVPITVNSGRTEPGAAGPLTAPAPGDGAPAEVAPPEPATAAGLIARFLPFDTADLRDAVGEFLRAMEPAIPAITGGLTPLGWAGLLAAALSAGAGVLLRRGKPPARWRPRAPRWPAVWRRGKRSGAGGSVPSGAANSFPAQAGPEGRQSEIRRPVS
jgi:hypothetical protein